MIGINVENKPRVLLTGKISIKKKCINERNIYFSPSLSFKITHSAICKISHSSTVRSNAHQPGLLFLDGRRGPVQGSSPADALPVQGPSRGVYAVNYRRMAAAQLTVYTPEAEKCMKTADIFPSQNAVLSHAQGKTDNSVALGIRHRALHMLGNHPIVHASCVDGSLL